MEDPERELKEHPNVKSPESMRGRIFRLRMSEKQVSLETRADTKNLFGTRLNFHFRHYNTPPQRASFNLPNAAHNKLTT